MRPFLPSLETGQNLLEAWGRCKRQWGEHFIALKHGADTFYAVSGHGADTFLPLTAISNILSHGKNDRMPRGFDFFSCCQLWGEYFFTSLFAMGHYFFLSNTFHLHRPYAPNKFCLVPMRLISFFWHPSKYMYERSGSRAKFLKQWVPCKVNMTPFC